MVVFVVALTRVPCFPAVKEAAVQRRHNLYRDSLILTNSDPNLHLLGETPSVDWSAKFGGDEPEGFVSAGGTEGEGSSKRRRQVVSMIQLDGVPLPYESCLEVPGVELIPEEDTEMFEGKQEREDEEDRASPDDPKSPDSVIGIRGLINPVVEMVVPVSEQNQSEVTQSTKKEVTTGTIIMEDGMKEDITHVTTTVEAIPKKSLKGRSSPLAILQELKGSNKQEADKEHPEEAVFKNETAAQGDNSEQIAEVSAAESDFESSTKPTHGTDSSPGIDSGFQSPTSEVLDEGDPQPVTESLNGDEKIPSAPKAEVVLV